MSLYDLFIFAGEHSGDLHGARLIREMKKRKPGIKILAVAGPQMRKELPDVFLNMEDFQTMGFLDVVCALPKLFFLFQKIKRKILKENPPQCIFIDYPEFNLKMEKSLRKNNYKGKLVHYICPSVWAWRKNRIETMTQNLDLLLTVFPFEKKYFKDTSLPTHYIGNPLVEKVAEYKYNPHWMTPTKGKILSIFPGSRKKEIENNLPIQIEAAKQALSDNADLTLAISIASEEIKKTILKICKKHNCLSNTIFIPSSCNYDLMKMSSAAIATSGTITLELALHEVPTVVGYKVRPIDLFLAKNVFRILLPFYCIANITLGKEVFKEAYGPCFYTENLSFHIKRLLSDEISIQRCKEDCRLLKNLLTSPKDLRTAADLILFSSGN